MKVKDVIDRIKFATATLDDLSGKSSNNLFSNKNICQQLKFALDKYASVTLALEATYSRALDTKSPYTEPPPDAIRANTYNAISIFINGVMYPINMTQLSVAHSQYPFNTTNGIPRWFVPWGNLVYTFPNNITIYPTSLLANDIDAFETDIELTVASNFVQRNGYIEIGEEKIMYGFVDGNFLRQCVRGVQNTIAVNHSENSIVINDNVIFNYYKRHFEIPVGINDTIPTEVLDMDMEICDEHLEFICDYTTYKLLIKVDVDRAKTYYVDLDQKLELAKYYIGDGRNNTTIGLNIRDQYIQETSYYDNVFW